MNNEETQMLNLSTKMLDQLSATPLHVALGALAMTLDAALTHAPKEHQHAFSMTLRHIADKMVSSVTN